jgi:hypothetical protein
MAQGAVDHPSYLTRQAISLGITTAGANGTSGGFSFISDMRIRKVSATVRTAGTSAGSGNQVQLLCVGTCYTGFSTGAMGTAITTNTGTTTLGFVALGSTAAYTVTTSSDFNVRLQAGSTLVMKNGTDATGVAAIVMEAYLDPSATWTGPNN